jgi:hypothetical protein
MKLADYKTAWDFLTAGKVGSYEAMAEIVANSFIQRKIPPEETLKQLIEQRGLNKEQAHRVLELANRMINEYLYAKNKDRNPRFTFPAAKIDNLFPEAPKQKSKKREKSACGPSCQKCTSCNQCKTCGKCKCKQADEPIASQFLTAKTANDTSEDSWEFNFLYRTPTEADKAAERMFIQQTVDILGPEFFTELAKEKGAIKTAEERLQQIHPKEWEYYHKEFIRLCDAEQEAARLNILTSLHKFAEIWESYGDDGMKKDELSYAAAIILGPEWAYDFIRQIKGNDVYDPPLDRDDWQKLAEYLDLEDPTSKELLSFAENIAVYRTMDEFKKIPINEFQKIAQWGVVSNLVKLLPNVSGRISAVSPSLTAGAQMLRNELTPSSSVPSLRDLFGKIPQDLRSALFWWLVPGLGQKFGPAIQNVWNKMTSPFRAVWNLIEGSTGYSYATA